MLKLRIALCLAVVAGTLTLTNGFFYGARTVTIIYRVAISIAAFGFLGYGVGIVAENYVKDLLVKKHEQELEDKTIDTAREQPTIDELPDESEFSPFTSDNFQQISRPKE